ncbi:hypothetical protein DSO57_1023293, partial [Entomophthora muscae]
MDAHAPGIENKPQVSSLLAQILEREDDPDKDNNNMITKLKEKMESEPDETKKKEFQTKILKLTYPTFWKNIRAMSANFEKIQKRSPLKERPKIIRDWTAEGFNVSIPLPDLIEMLSSKLVG